MSKTTETVQSPATEQTPKGITVPNGGDERIDGRDAAIAQLRDELARAQRQADDLRQDCERLAARLEDRDDRPNFRIGGAGEAALVVTALLGLHSASHGAARYDNRFLTLATRLGDALADACPPPA